MSKHNSGMHQKVFTEEEERELAFLHGRAWEFNEVSRDMLQKSIKSNDEVRRRFYRTMSQVFTRVSKFFGEFYDLIEQDMKDGKVGKNG